MTSRRSQTGFSLIELMVVLSIAVIVLTIALPNLRQFLVQSRIQSAASELVSSFVLARSEAIRRGVPVTVCMSANGSTCASSGTSGWEQGWVVFVDPNANSSGIGTDANILRDVSARTNVSLLGNATRGFERRMTFLPNGLPPANYVGTNVAVNSWINNDVPTADRRLVRYVCVSRTGRARTLNEAEFLSDGSCGNT
jgi:type IV fimbrial biogenesis protein FimT